MNNKLLIIFVSFLTILFILPEFINLVEIQKYHLLLGHNRWSDHYKWNIFFSVVLAFLLSYLPGKIPFVFRLLFVILVIPIFIFFGNITMNDTYSKIDFLLSKNQKVKKINYKNEKFWRLHQIIIENTDTVYLSQHPNLSDTVPVSELKKLRIKESLITPKTYHYYFAD